MIFIQAQIITAVPGSVYTCACLYKKTIYERKFIDMPITHILEHNATLFKNDISLVELNPGDDAKPRMTWKEYSLMEPKGRARFRKEITWGEFNTQANRFAKLLLSRGIKKGDKVAILLMNCIEWLPI